MGKKGPLARTGLTDSVVAELREILAEEGLEAEQIADDDSVTNDLGLKSKTGIEFTVRIEDETGIAIPHHVNLFVDDECRRGRTVGEIVAFLEELVSKGE